MRPLLHLEIVNVAARRWGWQRSVLVELAGALGTLNFEMREPRLHDVTEWMARGLTAYDASNVAIAGAEGIKLIADDRPILAVAPDDTLPLAGIGR